jgi:hypothetical protein
VQNSQIQSYALAMLIGIFLIIGRSLPPRPVLGALMDFFAPTCFPS